MIPRAMAAKALQLAEKFPIVSITGPRQSGKTTLVKQTFPDYAYVSLEDPDIRDFATTDPRSFLLRYNNKTIFDEAQNVPELFSYLQGLVDNDNASGRFILSGSQNFLLLKSISQSLAGRVAILNLLPLALEEIRNSEIEELLCWSEWIFRGGYPRIYSSLIDPPDYFPNYIKTYLDRDVRQGAEVLKLAEFNRFLELCGTRVGTVLNQDALAREADITVKTCSRWISVLESSYILFLLRPYHKNLGKRLIKSPKLYFVDTGLACSMVGCESNQDIEISTCKGELFENAIISDILKNFYNKGKQPSIYYWRDSQKHEIDLVIEKNRQAYCAIKIKASRTYKDSQFKHLDSFGKALEIPRERRFVVYAGDESFETLHGLVLSWSDLCEIEKMI